jgi:hypothetical protein
MDQTAKNPCHYMLQIIRLKDIFQYGLVSLQMVEYCFTLFP